MAESVRKGWELQIRAIPNEWNAMAEAEVVFYNAHESDQPRTAQEDMAAVAHSLPSEAPVHWKFDPFDSISLYRAVKRFHELFAEQREGS